MPKPVLVSFPKSGRTWLRYMLHHAGSEFELSHAGAGHRQLRTFSEIAPLLSEFVARRIIFMARDPRDTTLSGYYQATKRLRIFDGDFRTFIRHPQFGIEKNVRFNLHWAEAAGSFRSFLIVSYEDLHIDPIAHLGRVIEYIDRRSPDPRRVEAAVAAGSFSNMRSIEASGRGAEIFGNALKPFDASDSDTYKTRKGLIGGWRQLFSESDINYCNLVLDRYNYFALMDHNIA